MGTLGTPGQLIFQVGLAGVTGGTTGVAVCAGESGTRHAAAKTPSEMKLLMADLITEAPLRVQLGKPDSAVSRIVALWREVCP